jgi:hypothetical protein
VINLESTILSQFATSPVLMQLISDFNVNVDPTANFNEFFNKVWNIKTAETYGLDNWGRIVGVRRTFSYLGASYTLDDESFLTLILVKALANITNCSAPVFNQLISQLFAADGRCYVTDPGGMTMIYAFEFIISSIDEAILAGSGALPHPTGVKTILLSLIIADTFGFKDSGFQPFNQGTFAKQIHVA